MKNLIERLRVQASAHRYMDEPDRAKLLDEAVAALEKAEKKPPKPAVAFDNPLVQRVYEVLTDERNPPDGEHWEGFVARRIVETLLHSDCKADRQYLMELAAHFDGSPVPEIKAHRQRLITIANKLV